MGISDSWERGLAMQPVWGPAQSSWFSELNSPPQVVFCHRNEEVATGKFWSLVLLEDNLKKKLQVQKAEVLFIAFLSYSTEACTTTTTTTIWWVFYGGVPTPDTASHIMVSASRIIENLEIASCLCLGVWTWGFRPNVAGKWLVRWSKPSFGLKSFLALLTSLNLNMLIDIAGCQRWGLCSGVTSSGQKEANMEDLGHQGVEMMTGGCVYLAKALGGSMRKATGASKWRCWKGSETETPKGWGDYPSEPQRKLINHLMQLFLLNEDDTDASAKGPPLERTIKTLPCWKRLFFTQMLRMPTFLPLGQEYVAFPIEK